MKQLMLAGVGFLSVVLGTDLVGAEQQLLFCNKPVLKDIRRDYFYPVLTIQECGRIARVNQQLSAEIGNVSLYQSTNFKDLKKAVKYAWSCYGEAGCSPRIKLCFFEVPRFEKVFHVRPEQLIAHWIKKVVRPGIWREDRDCFIGKDEGGYSLGYNDNHHITLKPSNSGCSVICIDKEDREKNDEFNSIMTIYNIGQHAKSLNKEELDAFINNAIEKPLVVVLEKNLIGNDEIWNMLLAQFEKLNTENNNIIGQCLEVLKQHGEFYSTVKKAVQEVNQEEIAKLEDLKDRFAKLTAGVNSSLLLQQPEENIGKSDIITKQQPENTDSKQTTSGAPVWPCMLQ